MSKLCVIMDKNKSGGENHEKIEDHRRRFGEEDDSRRATREDCRDDCRGVVHLADDLQLFESHGQCGFSGRNAYLCSSAGALAL